MGEAFQLPDVSRVVGLLSHPLKNRLAPVFSWVTTGS